MLLVGVSDAVFWESKSLLEGVFSRVVYRLQNRNEVEMLAPSFISFSLSHMAVQFLTLSQNKQERSKIETELPECQGREEPLSLLGCFP
jgi:hypothetical protein